MWNVKLTTAGAVTLAGLATLVQVQTQMRNSSQTVVSTESFETWNPRVTNLQFIDPRSYAVLGANSLNFRNSSGTQFFNPTNSTPPFFQIFDESFKLLLGSSPSLHLIASNDSYAFAHEAPIWVESTDEVFFAANSGGALGMSDINHNSKVGKISVREAEKSLSAPGNNGTVQVNVTEVCTIVTIYVLRMLILSLA
jgi:gluconolactonase